MGLTQESVPSAGIHDRRQLRNASVGVYITQFGVRQFAAVRPPGSGLGLKPTVGILNFPVTCSRERHYQIACCTGI